MIHHGKYEYYGGFENLSHRSNSATGLTQPPENLSQRRFTLPEALEGNYMKNKLKPHVTSAQSHNLRILRFRFFT
jgi:hypothetical protein